MFPLELLADLPNPRDDEPASLRIDIVDELTDHLHCAFRREVLKDGDEAAAQRRTLDRFGDPKQLARRLWWQAMWSRIMKQRIVSALQWSVALVLILISGAVFWQQSQMLAELRQSRLEEAAQRKEDATLRRKDAAERQAFAAKIGQLQVMAAVPIHQPPADHALMPTDMPSAPGAPDLIEPPRIAGNPPFDGGQMRTAIPPLDGPEEIPAPIVEPPQLTLKLVQGTAKGESVTLGSAQITITDSRGVEQSAQLIPPITRVPVTVAEPQEATKAETVGIDTAAYGFRSLEPGHHQLRIKLADGQSSLRTVLIRDNKPQEMKIVCPPPRQKASLQITVPPVPEDLREAGVSLDVRIDERPVTAGDCNWAPPSASVQVLSFEPRTGKATGLVQDERRPGDGFVDLHNVKAEDCLLFIASGPIGIRYQLSLRNPDAPSDWSSSVTSIQYPQSGSEDGWLERTADAGENRWQLELPKDLLAAARGKLKADGEPHAPSPAAVNAPPRTPRKPQLLIKLVPEAENGPPVKGHIVAVRSAEMNAAAKLLVGGGEEMYMFDRLPPDQYELTITLADNQNQACTRPLLVEDEEPRELTIVCPGPRKKVPVGLTIQPLPEKLAKLNLDVQMVVGAGPVEIGKIRWEAPHLPTQLITFDAGTGLPREVDITTPIGQQHFNLRDLPADERRVFLPVGTVEYRFRVSEHLNGVGSVPIFNWPNASQEATSLKHVIRADEKTWNLELPPEYLDELLKGYYARGVEGTLRELYGTWRTGDEAGDVVFEFTPGGWRAGQQGKQPGDWHPFKLDVDRDPFRMDMDAMQGVFQLKDDELILCIGPKRPTGLEPAPGEQVERYVLKRDTFVPKSGRSLKNDDTDSAEGGSSPE